MKYFRLTDESGFTQQYICTESNSEPIPKDDTTVVEEISEETFESALTHKTSRLDLFMPSI